MASTTYILELIEGRGLLVTAGFLFVCLLLWEKFFKNKGELPLPPKPPGYPLLGNAVEFIKAAKKGRMHLLLEKWAREHGELIRVQIGPVTNFYINSDRCVK